MTLYVPPAVSADKGNLASVSPVDGNVYASIYTPMSSLGTAYQASPMTGVVAHDTWAADAAVGDGTVWYVPFLAVCKGGANRYVSVFACQVLSASGSPVMRFNVYSDSGTGFSGLPGYPVTKQGVADAVTSAISPTPGIKSVGVASGSRPTLVHGTWYWLAVCAQGGTALSVLGGNLVQPGTQFISSALMAPMTAGAYDNTNYLTGNALPSTAVPILVNGAGFTSPQVRFQSNTAA